MRNFIARTVLVGMLGVVGIPGVALATKPPHPTTPANHPIPIVTFVLHGKLSNYVAATTSVNGTVTITVKSSNMERAALKNQVLTFGVLSSTKAVLHRHHPIANDDRGIVKIRALKGSTAAMLQTKLAFEIIDQGRK